MRRTPSNAPAIEQRQSKNKETKKNYEAKHADSSSHRPRPTKGDSASNLCKPEIFAARCHCSIQTLPVYAATLESSGHATVSVTRLDSEVIRMLPDDSANTILSMLNGSAAVIPLLTPIDDD